MPLTAKITNPAFANKAQMATASRNANNESTEVIRELEGDEPEDVLFDTLFGVRTIELNRPKKLHSLNGSMIRKIVPRLQEWSKSDMANVVIIKGSGPKAFCAGGDVTALAEDNKQGPEGQRRSTDYFALEYKLDHLIATYPKPYVAFLDGITMGGGVGLSIHAPFRIATEKTVFAMPETTIGFFPDVGASFFLPRMPGAVGTYLALTSEKLKGVNVFYAGIATHYIHSTSLPALERRLAELRFKDYQHISKRSELIDSTIEEFCTGLPHDEEILIQGRLRNNIDAVFGRQSVPEIIAALERIIASVDEIATTKAEFAKKKEQRRRMENGEDLESPYELRYRVDQKDLESKQWAEKTLETIRKRSPTSVYVTLRQMQLGRNWSIAETFQREHQIADKFMKHPDFTEGVSALLIRKDGKPQWKPESLDQVKPGDNIEDPFFQIEGAQRLRLLSSSDYYEYPHRKFSIPRESDIKALVMGGGKTSKEVVDYFVKQRKGKQGVKEVVAEVMNRKTKGEHGKAVWIE